MRSFSATELLDSVIANAWYSAGYLSASEVLPFADTLSSQGRTRHDLAAEVIPTLIDIGRTADAQALWTAARDNGQVKDKDEWRYAVGRLAEACGLTEIAIERYAAVQRPDPDSARRDVLERLARLRAAAK